MRTTSVFWTSTGATATGANGTLTTDTTSPRTRSAPTALRTSSLICSSSPAVRGVPVVALLFGSGARSATSTATVKRLIEHGTAANVSVVFVFSYVVDV